MTYNIRYDILIINTSKYELGGIEMKFLEVGKTYEFRQSTIGFHFTAIVIENLDWEKDYTLRVLESSSKTRFPAGGISYISLDMIQSEFFTIKEYSKEEIESDKIKLNPELKRVFIELALQTGDKDWFMELTKQEVVEQ